MQEKRWLELRCKWCDDLRKSGNVNRSGSRSAEGQNCAALLAVAIITHYRECAVWRLLGTKVDGSRRWGAKVSGQSGGCGWSEAEEKHAMEKDGGICLDVALDRVLLLWLGPFAFQPGWVNRAPIQMVLRSPARPPPSPFFLLYVVTLSCRAFDRITTKTVALPLLYSFPPCSY